MPAIDRHWMRSGSIKSFSSINALGGISGKESVASLTSDVDLLAMSGDGGGGAGQNRLLKRR